MGKEKTKIPPYNFWVTFLIWITPLQMGISPLYELKIYETQLCWKDNSKTFRFSSNGTHKSSYSEMYSCLMFTQTIKELTNYFNEFPLIFFEINVLHLVTLTFKKNLYLLVKT